MEYRFFIDAKPNFSYLRYPVMGYTELQTHISNAKTYIASQDWDNAELELMQAEAELVVIPDTEHREKAVRYDRQLIERLQKQVQRNKSGALGIQRQKTTYIRTTS